MRLVETTDFRLGQAGDQLAVGVGQGRGFDPPYLAFVNDQKIAGVQYPVDFGNAGAGCIKQAVVALCFGSRSSRNGDGQRRGCEDQGGKFTHGFTPLVFNCSVTMNG